MELTAGTRLGYSEILGSLGAGGMGRVSRARDVKLDRPVAIKVLRHDCAYEPWLPARPAAHVWVPQLEPTDCGLAALAMVGRRLGSGVS
jgi:hypothetical protein